MGRRGPGLGGSPQRPEQQQARREQQERQLSAGSRRLRRQQKQFGDPLEESEPSEKQLAALHLSMAKSKRVPRVGMGVWTARGRDALAVGVEAEALEGVPVQQWPAESQRLPRRS